MALTEQFLMEEVRLSLGSSYVNVELSDDAIRAAIRDAMRRYSRVNPMRDREALEIPSAGIKSIPVGPDVYAITDVEFQDSLNVLEGRDHLQFNIFNSWQVIGAGYGAGGFGRSDEYAILKQWRDMTRREFSLEPDWYFEEDTQYDEDTDLEAQTKRVHFFNPTGLPLRAMWFELRVRPLEKVVARDHDWIHDWVLAESKLTLSHVRGKHRAIPTAGNQQLQLNGEALAAEALAEKERLLTELHDRFIGMPPFLWG